jgi:hypothetical protein
VRKVFGQETKECFAMPAAKKLTLSAALRISCVGRLLTIYFLVMLGFNLFYVSFPIHAVRRLRWEVVDTGTYFAVLSLLLVLVQGPLLSRVSRRLNEATLIPFGSLILSASFLCYLSEQIVWIYVGAVLLALGNGLMWPSVVSVLSKHAGTRYQGAIQGLASSSGAVASIMGLLLGGLLYELVSEQVFIVVAGIIMLVFLSSWRLAAGASESAAAS